MTDGSAANDVPSRGFTRRGLLKTAGVAGAGVSLGVGGFVAGHEAAEASTGDGRHDPVLG